jgi:hypothetical protein
LRERARQLAARVEEELQQELQLRRQVEDEQQRAAEEIKEANAKRRKMEDEVRQLRERERELASQVEIAEEKHQQHVRQLEEEVAAMRAQQEALAAKVQAEERVKTAELEEELERSRKREQELAGQVQEAAVSRSQVQRQLQEELRRLREALAETEEGNYPEDEELVLKLSNAEAAAEAAEKEAERARQRVELERNRVLALEEELVELQAAVRSQEIEWSVKNASEEGAERRQSRSKATKEKRAREEIKLAEVRQKKAETLKATNGTGSSVSSVFKPLEIALNLERSLERMNEARLLPPLRPKPSTQPLGAEGVQVLQRQWACEPIEGLGFRVVGCGCSREQKSARAPDLTPECVDARHVR